MLDFLFQYGLFLLKTITFVIAFAIVLSIIVSARKKNTLPTGELLITCLNDEHDETLHDVQELTLSKGQFKKWQKDLKHEKKHKNRNRLFVFNFDGDIRASQTESLTKIINTIISIKQEGDEVLCRLESGGGMVHSYGLACAELARLRDHDIPLTVAIDKVAASGGYLMAAVANHIIAAPFAVVGSIGVVAQIPNFHRLLEKNDIDFEQITAGEYKRTLTMFGENTEKGRQKMVEEVEKTHDLFKQTLTQYRPQLSIDEVATGEHWHALEAFQYKLIDQIQTSEAFITAKLAEQKIYSLDYEEEKTMGEKFMERFTASIEKSVEKILHKKQLV